MSRDWDADLFEQTLNELSARGLRRRVRTISGPQGPRVLLDGRPVLLLCSDNYLGLADHPRIREAAAEAAMRYGAGCGGPRAGSGGMRVHRRLEAKLSDFTRCGTALLFGSGYNASASAVSALVQPDEVVLGDGPGNQGAVDGCRLAGGRWIGLERGDLEELRWALQAADGLASLIVTEGLSGTDGSVARLAEIVELAHEHDARVLVDESHALGAFGPGGRGAVAAAGLEDDVDVTVSSLGKALGSQGGYVSCDRQLAKVLINTASAQLFSTALAPPSTAAALASLELLSEQPHRVEKLQRNASVLRAALARHGLDPVGEQGHVIALPLPSAIDAQSAAERALEKGVFVEAVRPPAVARDGCAIRLTVMSAHTKPELKDAAQAVARAMPARTRGPRSLEAPVDSRTPRSERDGQVFDGLADAA